MHELVHFLKLIILFSFTLSTGRYLTSLFLKAYQAFSLQVGKYCSCSIFQKFPHLTFLPQMKAFLSDSYQIHQHRFNHTETSKLISFSDMWRARENICSLGLMKLDRYCLPACTSCPNFTVQFIVLSREDNFPKNNFHWCKILTRKLALFLYLTPKSMNKFHFCICSEISLADIGYNTKRGKI